MGGFGQNSKNKKALPVCKVKQIGVFGQVFSLKFWTNCANDKDASDFQFVQQLGLCKVMQDKYILLDDHTFTAERPL